MPTMTAMTAKRKEIMNAAMRERAFECATELLRAEGWRKFTMEKLARAMGVSKGTLYNYFVDKRDVICFIRKCIVEDVCTMVEKGLGSVVDSREFLNRVIDITLERMGEFRFVAMAFLDMALTQDRESFLECASDFIQEKMLADVLKRCMDEGIVRQGDPLLMAITLNASIAALELSCNLVYGYDISEPKVRKQVADWLLNGILVDKEDMEDK